MSRNTYYLAPHHRLPRDAVWLLISVILLIVIWRIAPQQLPIVSYKLCLVTVAASVGFWLDRTFFPYARPDSYLNDDSPKETQTYRWCRTRSQSAGDGTGSMLALQISEDSLLLPALRRIYKMKEPYQCC